MISLPSPSLKVLVELGPSGLFRLAETSHKCAFIAGPNETVVAIGVAKRIHIDRGLSSLDPLDEIYVPSISAEISKEHLCVAAIPFDNCDPFEITVPELAVIFNIDGSIEITFPDHVEKASLDLLNDLIHRTETPHETPNVHYEPVEVESTHAFVERVRTAKEVIKWSGLNKVVLSKSLKLKMVGILHRNSIFYKLQQDRPASYLFSIENFIGASPELVVELKDQQLKSFPLAGTASASNKSELLLSEKDNEEHQIVVAQILQRLRHLGVNTKWQEHPTVTGYGEIIHLGSEIQGVLPEQRGLSSVEIAAHIAPTAAINGDPPDQAKKYIADSEPLKRGLYGGLVGYQKRGGDGCWILNIRSIEIGSDSLSLRAGVGIVSQSDPETENDEAESKINSILSSLLD